ncbi:hypothetical protein HPB49_005809 [Dermacentor silvarum]|uniref:Uncharacterized protein n=1 Tax=Dermacentor silvarum TaxID=543639 RepID=A0ACB8DVX6_DERSI|nr:hypothetical protein HPB49_005809 [Dermacentor silvarum]
MEKMKNTNFSEEERTVLLELVSRHRRVVESKTDAVTDRRKRESWKKIEDEFNCRHNVMPRTWGQLKKCWENLKDKWRSQDAADEPDYWFWDDAGRPPAEPETILPHYRPLQTAERSFMVQQFRKLL